MMKAKQTKSKRMKGKQEGRRRSDEVERLTRLLIGALIRRTIE
jgi:hypothetical protein